MAADRVYTFLLLKVGGKNTKLIVLDTQDLTVGRAPENDLVLEDPEASRHHATFRRGEAGWSVQNFSLSNLTCVNDESVDARSLANKDTVKIAETELVYYRVAKNPVTLGLPVVYASQLKDFTGPSIAAGDGEATILGLVNDLGGEEDFVVGPVNDFSGDGLEGPAPKTRNLDLELGSEGLDSLDMPPAKPQPAPQRAGDSGSMGAWTLDEKPRSDTLSVHLEIEGLSGSQRASVEALLGKVIELPRLRIRLKGDDLG